MPRKRLVRERYVRWIAKWNAKWRGPEPGSADAREIERLALLFTEEGMGPWEAVDSATVLVLREFERAGAA